MLKVFLEILCFSEKARQAAQIKLLRKLQKQEQARIAKEAKKQQGEWVKRKHKLEEWVLGSSQEASLLCSFSDDTCVLAFHHSNNGCWGEATAKRADKDYETTGMFMHWTGFITGDTLGVDLLMCICTLFLFDLWNNFHTCYISYLESCHLPLFKIHLYFKPSL